MSWQTLVRAWMLVLLACISPVALIANTISEVGASNKVSALPIFASQPIACADTVKSFDQLAKELLEEKKHHEEVSDPDSLLARKQKGILRPDTLLTAADSARLRRITDSLTHIPRLPLTKVKMRFIPNPNKALWLSLVFPGAGQIYNRKYWKLPIIYGGFMGCTYALMWNQMMYRDYSQAYLDIMDDDPNTNSYLDMLPPRYDITGREEQFKNVFKRKKDFYRRYRDLSAFCFVGVYLLSVIDAYVDAQLSVFDISPDLSMKVEPAVIGAPNMLGSNKRAAYGVGCSLSF